jgi:hypothetical protein
VNLQTRLQSAQVIRTLHPAYQDFIVLVDEDAEIVVAKVGGKE